ncbi:MAG: hypothetical protein JXB32_02300 [Deltaproteobacteria bacterium]|nr:hypothetical protein [Deltaproteobacteria bacterium]
MEGARAGAAGEQHGGSSGRRAVEVSRGVPWLCAGLVLCTAAPAAAQRSSKELIDRVAVVVEGSSARDRDGQVATLWDLFVVAHVSLIREAGPGAFGRFCDAAAFRDAQRLVVEQLVALREAVRLGRDVIPPGLVDEARDRLAALLGGHDVLRAFLRERAISMESLDAALRREVIVTRFTRDSVRLPSTLDLAELEARFVLGGHPFEGRPFLEAAAEFEAWLRVEQLEEYRQRWLVELRGRCRLIVNDVAQDLASAAPGEGD